MTRRDRRRNARTGAARKNGKATSRILPAAAVLLVVAVALIATRDAGAAHPKPRDIDHTGSVVDHSRYDNYPRVAEVYRQAAEVPHVLDGLYCYCACAEHSGHYSLLDCFKSDHGAGCDICLTEAAMAHQMTSAGATLDEIRSAVDDFYRG